MPPTLDLSRTSHARVAIAPPRINLRRAASYNHDRGPLSSTSSRFNFNHLVFSPPPSPGLPSLSPPLKKANRGLFGRIHPIRLIRYAIRLLSIVLVFYVSLEVLTRLFGEPVPAPPPTLAPPPAPEPPAEPTDRVEMVSQKDAPDFPTPMVITDHRGRAKWTVSIPPGSGFPLTIGEYTDMCIKCRQVASRAYKLRSERHGLQQMSLGFSDSADHGFIDVQEAEDAGYLPAPPVAKTGVPAIGDLVRGDEAEKPVCRKSLTFVLESSDGGLGKTLMMLWIAYGLAQKEGRAFFIDDTRWSYGKYTAIFQPPPLPDCSAPPSHEILPCPRQARHLVTSAATADELFGSLTKDLDPPSDSHDRALRKTQFALARQGYEALSRLNKDDGDYVDARVRELLAKRIVPKSKGQRNGLAVGVHVRRGDRHPLEYQYRHSYMPLNMYSDTARETIEARFNGTGPFSGEDAAAKEQSFVILASDDPMVYESAELSGASRAQERIKLASKQTIQKVNPDRSVMHKFVDETFGWEGGFFAAMFWNLGASRSTATQAADAAGGIAPPPSAETLRLRSLVGRAYMMDLAVLADASDVVVCAVSAVGCRLLAVMMGWDSAMEEGNWVNIDGRYGWMGLEW
ncbi:Alternative oxidase [Madurella fahalii]|uniref:Alternative oxidase n=1 Tax=Madurella fahalii TaxID=1157608 RepID=A0ABQ0FXU0_9PEZI